MPILNLIKRFFLENRYAANSYTPYYVILSLFLIFYVLYRAICIGITYDESWTISSFVPLSLSDIFCLEQNNANNHIFNTLLIKLFYFFYNGSLFIARLPNVLAFLVYLFFIYKICTRFFKPTPGLLAFVLLLLNPFLLDFFSIARGYGLALAFQLGSLYYTLVYFKNKSSFYVILSLGFGGLSVLSGFSMLVFWISTFLIIVFFTLVKYKEYKVLKTIIFCFLTAFLLASLVLQPLTGLLENGSLYYGGNNNFYCDTLISLSKYTLYNSEVSLTANISLNVLLVFIFISLGYSYFKEVKLITAKTLVFLITISCISGILLLHYLFGTFYVIDRTALFFYPLFILCLTLAINDIWHLWLSRIILWICISAFFANFCINANMYKTAIWGLEAHSESILDILNEKGESEDKIINLDFSWPLENSIYYYFNKNKYPYVQIVNDKSCRGSVNPKTDYYIFLNRDLEGVVYVSSQHKINQYQKNTFLDYKEESVIVFSDLKTDQADK